MSLLPGRRLLTALTLGLALGCAGFDFDPFTKRELVDVSREEAVARGYTPPEGATGFHVRDRASMDVRSLWLRYDLPPEAFQALLEQIRESGEPVEAWLIPDNWPVFTNVFHDDPWFETPEWFDPEGAPQVLRLERPHGEASSHSTGTQWAFDPERGRVWIWTWSWQFWNLER